MNTYAKALFSGGCYNTLIKFFRAGSDSMEIYIAYRDLQKYFTEHVLSGGPLRQHLTPHTYSPAQKPFFRVIIEE